MEKTTSADPQSQASFYVRTAEADDILICSQFDASYQTSHVWQMNFSADDERSIQCAFTRVKLPRTMPVSSPYTPAETRAILEQSDYVFVAWYRDQIIGYVGGDVEDWRQTVIIRVFTVHPEIRRKGVGKLLLKMVKNAAQQYRCKYLAVTVQTKNYPAIAFAQKRGFVFCGYNDRYYPNGDIALNFSLAL